MEAKIKDKVIAQMVAKLYEGIEINPSISKLDGCSRNNIYLINDDAILKVFVGDNAKERFKKELDFIANNKTTLHLPKMANCSDNQDKFSHILYEKVNGMTLASIWDNVTHEQRETLIEYLMNELKILHSKEEKPYNWSNYIMKQINEVLAKLDMESYFNKKEIEEINNSIEKIPSLLENNPKFASIHGSINLSNVIYDLHNCILIDYEDSFIAPIDYEISELNRITNYPKSYASKKSKCKPLNYASIKDLVFKYYPEYKNIENLEERLAIYDLVYYLKELSKNLNSKKSHKFAKRASKAALIINKYSSLKYENISNETELMQFLDMHIRYGWIDNEYNVHRSLIDPDKYHVMSEQECLKYNVGTSIEQSNMAYNTFKRLGLSTKMFVIKSSDNQLFAFTLFNYKKSWYLFEHSNKNLMGVRDYPSIDDAIETVKESLGYRDVIIVETTVIPDGLSYNELFTYVNNNDNRKSLL